jgi:hypothetical protein
MYSLCSNAFVEALETVPAEDWSRSWPADRTIMLSKTSKKIRDIINNMRLPVDVRWSWTFWNDSRNGTVSEGNSRACLYKTGSTTKEKHEFIMMRLKRMVSLYNITTLVLKCCDIQIILHQLIEVLEQCPKLQKLNLMRNDINADGAAMIANVLCRRHNLELSDLDLSINKIGDKGAARIAELLVQCPSLTHLNLSLNKIGDAGVESLAKAISKCHNLALNDLELAYNLIQEDGAESLLKVLPQCPTIKYIELSWNHIGLDEVASIANRYNIDLGSLYKIRTVSYP